MPDPAEPSAAVVLVVDAADEVARLDAFLAQRLPQFSRVHLRRVITAGAVLVDDHGAKPAYRLVAGQTVALTLPELPRSGPAPEAIALDILYEDEYLAAINKPAGMVVHPAKGHWSGTLTSALAHHFQQLSAVGGPTRPGIVHRLDRETSGVIVVAKTDAAHMKLAAQFEARTTRKEYFALTRGVPDRDADVIRQPIRAHPYQREKMAIRAGHSTSREAETFYEVIQRYHGYAALRVLPKTGRTHQIRVHLTHAGFPVLCDRLYSGRSQITRAEILGDSADRASEVLLDRVALHALRLEILHPVTAEPLILEAPLAADIARTQDALRRMCG